MVGQHCGQTKLFRNLAGIPGVRVALRVPHENPHAIGAVVRLKYSERLGPARAVLAGGGYWSQDSPTIVLAAPASPASLQIQWPGGKSQAWPWPQGHKSVEVSADGIKTLIDANKR